MSAWKIEAKMTRLRKLALHLCSGFKIEGALIVEQFQIAENVLFDFLRIGFGIESLQVGDDFFDGVFAVAALNDFEARAVEEQGAFGHEEDALLHAVVAEAAAGSETRTSVQIESASHF